MRHGPDTYGASLTWETPAEVAAAASARGSRLDKLYASVTPQRHDPPPVVNPPEGSAARAATPQAQTHSQASHAAGFLTARVVLDGSDQGLAAGQYAVLYDAGGSCYGCGVIVQGSVEE